MTRARAQPSSSPLLQEEACLKYETPTTTESHDYACHRHDEIPAIWLGWGGIQPKPLAMLPTLCGYGEVCTATTREQLCSRGAGATLLPSLQVITSTHSNVPKCSSAPHTPICRDTRTQAGSTGTCCSPSTHRPVAPAAGVHQRAAEQTPLDISPLASPLSKGRRHRQRANSFAPQHPRKSRSALGKAVFWLPLLPSTQSFPLLTLARG